MERINGKDNCNATIVWQYEEEDEDMLEAGKDYAAMIDVPFEMEEVPDYRG